MPVTLPKHGSDFTLRSFTREEAEDLAEIEFDPEVKRFLAQPRKERAVWVATFDAEAYGGWAVEVQGTLAGRASILRAKRRGEGEIAIVIARPFWGLKLGRKVAAMLIRIAFEEMNASALVAKVHPENQASLALLRAFKFRRSGVIAAPDEWQDGHFLYRMSRGSFNRSVDTLR